MVRTVAAVFVLFVLKLRFFPQKSRLLARRITDFFREKTGSFGKKIWQQVRETTGWGYPQLDPLVKIRH